MNNPFLDACGATGPLLLNTESPGVVGGETRAFDLPFVLAGRDPRSDLRLDHPDVSERHAYLQMVDGQLVCIDLGSRVGIFQGGKCQRLGYLERDRAVRVGPYRIRLIGGDRVGGSVAPADAPPGPLPLELSHRSVRRSRCDLPAGLALVGSAADCQIRLVDPSVSNYHCSLVHTAAGVWVVDLLGVGGVRVNGHEVAYAQVHEGDSLQVGHSVIRLLERAGAFAAATTSAVESSAKDGDQLPAAPDLAEQFLAPMVSQFGAFQEQMAEEFRQARATFLESMSALHQEQMAFLSQEFDQLRRLSEDLNALRADLEQQSRLLSDQLQPTSTSPSPRLGAATNVTTTPALFSPPPTFHAHGVHAPTSPSGFVHAGPENHLIRGHNEQAHARLCVRIARLQKRQLTGWEKFLALFPGASPGKSTA